MPATIMGPMTTESRGGLAFSAGIVIGLAAVAALVWHFSRPVETVDDIYRPLETEQTKQEARESGYAYLSFDDLQGADKSDPDSPFAPPTSGIPETLRDQDGAAVVIEGFAEPLTIEREAVTEFRLIRHLASCCFGVSPQPNDVVHVVMDAGSPAVDVRLGDGVAVYGVLRLLDGRDPASSTLLYRVEATRVEIMTPF